MKQLIYLLPILLLACQQPVIEDIEERVEALEMAVSTTDTAEQLPEQPDEEPEPIPEIVEEPEPVAEPEPEAEPIPEPEPEVVIPSWTPEPLHFYTFPAGAEQNAETILQEWEKTEAEYNDFRIALSYYVELHNQNYPDDQWVWIGGGIE